MTLVQLKYFQTVCKYNNITRASNELHISQPSLSNAIKDLEKEFGISLFYRFSKGLVLTEEGSLFLEETNHLLEHADLFISRINGLNQLNQTVKLGVPPMLSTLIFPHLLQSFHESFPNINLQMVENETLSNKVMVLDNTLDAAIISCNDPLPASLGFYDICSMDIYFYTSINNKLCTKTTINLSDLSSTPLALLAENSFLTSFIKQCFKFQHLIPKVMLHTNQLATIHQLVENKTASTFLFDNIFPTEQNIVKIPVNGLPKIKIRLIWNANQTLSLGTQNLIRLSKLEYPHPYTEE